MPSRADIFKRFPIVAALLVGPVAPLYAVFNSLPFGGFLVFLALSFGSRQPDKLSRFVRFSFQQAILIDIALIFPQLFGSASDGHLYALGGGGGGGFGANARADVSPLVMAAHQPAAWGSHASPFDAALAR